MAIERSGSDPGGFGNIIQAGVCSRVGKGLFRHFENTLAVPSRIGARLSRGWRRRLSGHHYFQASRKDLQPETISGYLIY
jgi:hypothetical protein